MSAIPNGSLITRMLRGVTLAHVIAFVISLSLLLTGVFILATQWTAMQAQLIANAEKISALQAVVGTNEQRIQNQHIRLSALEMYNKELVDSMKSLSVDSKKMVELLSLHVFPSADPNETTGLDHDNSRK